MYIKYVTGFAGTGKSTELIKHLLTLDENKTIVLAPTHKALRVLSEKLDDNNYGLSTIHSLLGWVPGVNEQADNAHQVDITHKLDKQFEIGITNVIIDEFSMMSEEMLFELTSKIDELLDYESDGVTLTLYGDPYQLPPVKATPIQTDPAETTHLTTQHRSECKDIPALFEKFVAYLEGSNTSDLSLPESQNVKHVTSLEGFKRGDRALAYTNKTVGELNKNLAKQAGITTYKGAEVQMGNLPDTLIVENIYTNITKEILLGLYNNKTLALQDNRINQKFLEHTMHNLANDTAIMFVLCTDGNTYATLPGIGEANLIRKECKEAAANASKGSSARSKAWQRYYTINRAYTMDYTFASTVHKAQGSEFNTVWIHKDDMLKIIGPTRNYLQYARMIYVAISRAKQRVNIITN